MDPSSGCNPPGDNLHMYSVYYYNLRCDRLHTDLQLAHAPLQYIIIIVIQTRQGSSPVLSYGTWHNPSVIPRRYDSDWWIDYNPAYDMPHILLAFSDIHPHDIQYNLLSDVHLSVGSLNCHDQRLLLNLLLDDKQGRHCFHRYNHSRLHADHPSPGLYDRWYR